MFFPLDHLRFLMLSFCYIRTHRTKWEVIPGQILHAAGAPVIENGHTTVALQTGGAIDVSSMAPIAWEMALDFLRDFVGDFWESQVTEFETI